ncbi:AMP-binding protein [Nocardioides sp. WL0053]|uniref:AMP-binding protein n=1 Tax=Nocardioides jiangsuensis TaxID=2866161 RepID=A0ABS7RHV9_9ACTN|nr:AMP-binding protein [Nocardioides jiangsuensis]MBY9074629.1 AMP-binding protein [Nocardioides jiangsuensis]
MNDLPLTLQTLMAGALAKHAARPAVVVDGTAWTYGDLDRAANRLAHALLALGVAPGTPVALMMSNCAEYVVADLAVVKLGAAKVPLNDMLSPGEATYILRDSGAVVAVASSSQLDVAMSCLRAGEALRTVVALDADEAPPPDALPWSTALAGRSEDPPAVEVSATDVGLMLYTGGTTGRPKGVVHLQQQLALNLLAHRIETEIRSEERLLLSSPLPHSAGFLLQTALLAGAVSHVERGFDATAVLRAVTEEGVSFLFMVPTMIYRLLDRAAEGAWDLSSLRTILYGAAPMSPERLAEGLDRFGPVFMQLYGQSEAPNFITRLTREAHVTDEQHRHRLRSCGQPTAMAEVRIVDEDGRDCPAGAEGEVVARTAYTMSGYHGLPEATARTLQDGWLRTGDIGYLDEERYLYLLDRKNDMIITGGMNVYCSEVEAALREVEGVAQAAVVGVPHPDWGEAVVAFVVASEGVTLDETEVTRQCRGSLSAYKRPKAVHQVDQLPLTVYGKVDKKALREAWQAMAG